MQKDEEVGKVAQGTPVVICELHPIRMNFVSEY